MRQKILILGGTGMLGHHLLSRLSQHHDVWATVRRSPAQVPPLKHINREQLLVADALDFGTIDQAMRTVHPDIVINCIGLIKQREDARKRLPAIEINSRFPHLVAERCADMGSRMIHVSTDCVFSGAKGMYTEADPADATDVYGKSKALGEVVDADHVLTLRTSLIGHELSSQYSLVEWFLSQTGTVKGFKNAIFSGFPTTTVADIFEDVVFTNPDLHGLYHMSAEPIDKFTLLHLIKTAYQHPVEIVPDTAVCIDRSLDSTRFRAATGFAPPSWQAMITAMAEDVVRES